MEAVWATRWVVLPCEVDRDVTRESLDQDSARASLGLGWQASRVKLSELSAKIFLSKEGARREEAV